MSRARLFDHVLTQAERSHRYRQRLKGLLPAFVPRRQWPKRAKRGTAYGPITAEDEARWRCSAADFERMRPDSPNSSAAAMAQAIGGGPYGEPGSASPPMPSPLALSDIELDIVMRLAGPLQPADRAAFLEAVAARLAGHQGELGEGLVARTCRELQREFWDPPDLSTGNAKSKYAR
jgi:hypothetical protein